MVYDTLPIIKSTLKPLLLGLRKWTKDQDVMRRGKNHGCKRGYGDHVILLSKEVGKI
jgi:hypothetical protein